MTVGTLSQLATSVKSANAGATQITIDIVLPTSEVFDRVGTSLGRHRETIARLFGVAAADVQIYHYVPALTVKITVPRQVVSGGLAERDFDGVQQYIPLLDLEID